MTRRSLTLVTRTRDSAQQARDVLIERYTPLIWSSYRRHQLSGADADDVGQGLWLQVVDQLDRTRDPAALHGWLATTSRRGCGRALLAARKPQAVGYVLDAQNFPDEQTGIVEHELIIAEPNAVVHVAFITHPKPPATANALFTEDPPPPHIQISASLNTAIGSTGRNRRGCLDNLHRHPATAALINTETHSARSDTNGHAIEQ